MLFPKFHCPMWFLGHFNWFSFLSKLMEMTGAMDEVGLAYENVQRAFVPPFSWGQDIFPLVQEIPIVGGEVEMEEVTALRRRILPRAVPVYLENNLESMKSDLTGKFSFLGPVAWLHRIKDMPAAQIAIFEGRYSSVVTAVKAGVPSLVYTRDHELYKSVVEEMAGLGVALALDAYGEGFSVGDSDMALLFNRAPDAYSALPPLYRLDGSQFLVEQMADGL